MCLQVKTTGDAVKQVKNLFSILGIEYWSVYLSESRYFDNNPTYTENSKIEPALTDKYKVETALIVNDPVELFIENENFLFVCV